MSGREEIKYVPIDKIVPPEIPVRIYLDERFIDALGEYLSDSGFIHNILVRPKEGKFEVIVGHNRYEAAKKAGLKMVPVKILKVDDYETLRLRLKENILRQRMGKVSEAMTFQTMKALTKKTWKQKAADTMFSEDYIKRRVRLLKLPSEIQVFVEKGVIHPDSALELLRLPDKEYQFLIAKKVVEDRLTVDETRYLVTKQLVEIEKAEAEEEAPPPKPPEEVKPSLRKCACCGEMVPEEQIAPRYMCAECYGIALRALRMVS